MAEVEARICPILQAGRMMSGLGIRSSMEIQGDTQFSASVHYDKTSFCMGKDCEWFEHGCPAHPITKEVRDKIRAMK